MRRFKTSSKRRSPYLYLSVPLLLLVSLSFVLRTRNLNSENKKVTDPSSTLSSDTTSTKPDPERYLFSTPRSGGFNNQLITIYESIRCAQILGRTLVLPLIYENVRADTSSKGEGPYPFTDYFDIEHISKAVKAITPEKLFSNYNNPCDGSILYASSKHFFALEYRIPRLLKQQYRKLYKIQPVFMPELARRNGRRLREEALCIDDSACPNLESADEFGPYSDYEGDGQGYSLRTSSVLREIRSSFYPSATVKRIADSVLKNIGGPFNAVHLRRGDFDTKCSEIPKVCEKYGPESMWQTKQGLQQRIMKFKNPSLPLFVSTTHSEECRELLSGYGLNVVFMEDTEFPHPVMWALNRTDIIAYASQIVASRSEEFIGNRFSSYSTTINYIRILENSQEATQFF